METIFKIIKIDTDKKNYLNLLLIGDESESMIDRYLDKCNLYVGFIDNEPIALCATVNVDTEVIEIKNLAVLSKYRQQGYGRSMLEFVENLYSGKTIIIGTGETPSTLRFYKSCGYSYSHRILNFFTDNYPAPIIEENIMLCDMVYLKKALNQLNKPKQIM